LAAVASFAGHLSAHAATWPQPKQDFDLSRFQEMAILENGRRKPMDTFARETVRTVTGKQRFAGFDPNELLLSWLTQTKDWESLPIIDASYLPLQKQIHMTVEEGRVSPRQLKANQEFSLLLQAVTAKQQESQKLTELEQQAGKLMQRLNLFYGIASGSTLTLVPQASGPWLSLGQLSERYPDIRAVQQDPSLDARIAAGVQAMLSAYYQNDPKMFAQISYLTADLLQQQGNKVGKYPTVAEIDREIHFHRVEPFLWAWVGYALAFFIFLMSLWTRSRAVYWGGVLVMLAALAIHAYGFYLRCRIAGRAPVTNMYETVIWVSLGVAFFAFVFEMIYRPKYYALAGSALATLLLILAGSAPGILNPAIEPLVPVLRDNFWLTIHVLTITLSYAAFALALGVGNVNLGNYIVRPGATEKITQLNYFIYRSIQVGVVLLAAGTILGGVWANASWGRFWGWDPKEVWALIALLGYLSILHGRYAGWLKGFGLAVSSLLAFLLVVMAWYGVNFILGVGLHSYGFSSGGAKFVSVFVAIELLWIGFAVLRYKILFKESAVAA